jgi:hypothetical protein
MRTWEEQAKVFNKKVPMFDSYKEDIKNLIVWELDRRAGTDADLGIIFEPFSA